MKSLQHLVPLRQTDGTESDRARMRAKLRVVEPHDLAAAREWFDAEMQWLVARASPWRRLVAVFNSKGFGRAYFQNGNDPVSAR